MEKYDVLRQPSGSDARPIRKAAKFRELRSDLQDDFAAGATAFGEIERLFYPGKWKHRSDICLQLAGVREFVILFTKELWTSRTSVGHRERPACWQRPVPPASRDKSAMSGQPFPPVQALVSRR